MHKPDTGRKTVKGWNSHLSKNSKVTQGGSRGAIVQGEEETDVSASSRLQMTTECSCPGIAEL